MSISGESSFLSVDRKMRSPEGMMKFFRITFLHVLLGVSVFPLGSFSQSVKVSNWGRTRDGEKVKLYELSNKKGMKVAVMNYGATLVSVETPDRSGTLENITLHLESFDDYERGHPLFGSTVGRYASRIAEGGFTIDKKRFDLENVGRNGVHMHGGKKGLQKMVWEVDEVSENITAAVTFSHISPDGHEGYPGRLSVWVTYRLSDDNTLSIEYKASTTKPTHLNLTNHVYWNLNGAGNGDILDHQLTLKSEEILDFDDRRIPTGKFKSVAKSPFDFRKSKAIGSRIRKVDGGYDHCYVLSRENREGDPILFARLESPDSGRVMEVLTTEPSVQLYTANYLRDGRPYGPQHGVCLETQHFPDSPNNPSFPSTLLRPDETYRQVTEYRFSTAK